MRRILAASGLFAAGLFAAGLFALTAVAQPPAGGAKTEAKKEPEKKAVDPAEAAIAAALANDADIRTAQAKVLLAEAELAKARQVVVQKVVTLQSAIRQQREVFRLAEQKLAETRQIIERGSGSRVELLFAQEKFATVSADLAKLETELKLLTGDGRVPAAKFLNALNNNCIMCHQAGGGDRVAMAAWLGAGCPGMHGQPGGNAESAAKTLHDFLSKDLLAAPVKGPVADTLRVALDKKVTLAPKGQKVTLEQAIEVFKKDAGFDLPVRSAGGFRRVAEIVSGGEELPVGAWFQLFQDQCEGVIYVRDYGLLCATKETAPPDAITLTAFWKQRPADPRPTEPKKE